MVQKRSDGLKNPFDSDEAESPPSSRRYSSSSRPSAPPYRNPFEDDDDAHLDFNKREKPQKQQQPGDGYKNPFDDDLGGRKNNSKDGEEAPRRGRRRDAVKEKISTMSEEITNTASRMKPRSRNLMQSSGQNRKLLLEEDEQKSSQSIYLQQKAQQKADHDRIGRAVRDGTSLDGESVQQLEEYGIQKAEETTATVYNALRVAEEIKDGASNTVVQLHEQGEQIRRTHHTAADIETDLSRGEKLLGSLGGLFSRTWKPKKGRNITGPVINRGDSFKRKAYSLEQKAALGIGRRSSPPAATATGSSESQFQTRVQNEFAKQDDALADLSNIVGQLKEMSLDMGDEIRRQTDDLGHLEGDVDELGFRVKGANERARRLLGR